MIPPLIATGLEAASRSLLLAFAVWICLRIFRIRSIPAQKAAWSAVLASAILMPLLVPLAAHLPAATISIPAAASRMIAEPSASSSSLAAAPSDQPSVSAAPNPIPVSSTDEIYSRQPLMPIASPLHSISRSIFLSAAAAFLYFSIAGALLFRMLYGLYAALRLWRSAKPVCLEAAHRTGDLRVRFSHAVSSPVTLASGVVLPADYNTWDEEKLRIVLAHERAHIRHHDFYLQALASLYAALVWFSPLGWWLKRKLSDLGEAIGDRSGLEAAASSSSYAQILLEFAATPRPTPIGVAMARSSTLSRRIERILNPTAFRQAFTGGRRAILAAVLVPAAMLALTALVRVEAASQAQQQPASTPITGQAHPDSAEPAAASDTTRAPQTSAQQTQSTAPSSSTAPANRIDPIHVAVPPIHVDVPAVHVNVPAKHIDILEQHIDIPAIHVNVPGTTVDVPAQHIDVPATNVDVPAQHIDIPAQHIDVPAIHIDVPATGTGNPTDGRSANGNFSPGPTGELHAMLADFQQAIFPAGRRNALIQAGSSGAQATFDRTLTFNGKLDLAVATGSGSIHITRGAANQIHIHGIVKANWDGDPAEVQRIAAHPPIAQNGNSVCVGLRSGSESDCAGNGRESENHISISYEIEAPADTALNAGTGSGSIADTGVGHDTKLNTGSGSITATGIEGSFKTSTGSGDITIEAAGQGDAKASTGSGKIVLSGVHGSLEAQTGSGGIKVTGTPSSDWRLHTGSGSVDLSTGNAPIDLDASTGSGSISTNQPMTVKTIEDRHHLRAQLNGGGTPVRVETGSGSIHVE